MEGRERKIETGGGGAEKVRGASEGWRKSGDEESRRGRGAFR